MLINYRSNPIYVFFTKWQINLPAVIILLSALLLGSSSAFAYGVDECTGSRFGSDLVCTAGDVSITGISVAPGSPTSCVGGTTFDVDLDITVNFATPDRWDVGIFLSNDGNDPQLLPANGGASTCSVGILPTSTPFLDLDPNGGLDTCGDGNGTINGGTGAGVVRLTDVPVSCQAIASSGGNLYIPFVVSWDNQSSPSGANCTSILDPVPNTKSKCNAPDITNPIEVQYGTVNAVVLPDITKVDSVSSVNPGDTITYTVVISNTTGQPLNGAVFTDPATANLTISSVSCAASGGATCPTTTVAAMQGAGITLPSMPEDSILTFTIGGTATNPPSPLHSHIITNTANVTVSGETNSASDVNNIIGAIYSDLSNSTKTVVDLNGGEADPGDVLRYTITLNESVGLGVTGASVTDDVPPYVNNFTVVSTPTGAVDSSTGTGTGSNGTGYLNITGIDVAANGSEAIVFEVTIASGTPAGTTIDNFATVNNPGGPGGVPSAATVIVSPSSVPLTDNKKLYLYSTSPNTLSRNLPAGTPATVTLKNSSASWAATSPVPLQLDNTIQSAYATLFLSADSAQSRKIEARMYCSTNPAIYATSGIYDLGTVPGTATQYTFNLTTLMNGFTFPATCAASSHWVLRVDSHDQKNTIVHAVNGTGNSRINLDSSNVIYVENLEFYDDAYPLGTATTTATPGTTIYIRSVVSDPFGSFDISSATIDISEPDGTPVITTGLMTELLPEATAATKTFQYAYAVPSDATSGNWAVTVTANEGSEGTVTDDHTSAFTVAGFPDIKVAKSVATSWDPYNGFTNPFAIPGGIVEYTLTITNEGLGSPDANSILINDPVPAGTELVVSNPVITIANVPAETGLTVSYITPTDAGDDVYFSQDGSDYSYQPFADSNGADANVTHLQINPQGIFSASDGISHPSFEITFRVRIK